MFLRSHHHPTFRRITSLVLLVAMLVLGLGLPQLLLVCNKACCGGRVALGRSCGLQERAPERPAVAAAADADECPCCRKAQQATTRLGTISADAGGGCDGCEHQALGCELGLPQAFELPELPATPPCYLATLALRSVAPQALAAVHPPATGPPRPDPRTSLLATTVLRI